MNDVSTADQAIRELLDVSPHIEAAVIGTRDGTISSASFVESAANRADGLMRAAMAIVDQAERARVELGREPVVQCEVATGDGNVFVVTDDTHVIAAVTGNDPTVGLVFYDLKTALRSLRDAAQVASSNGTLAAASATSGTDSKSKKA